MASVVRLGDTSSHGGSMVSATGNFKTNGIKTCIDGDMHDCPIRGHGRTSVSGTASFKSNNRNVVKTGDIAGCGAVINTGSADTTT